MILLSTSGLPITLSENTYKLSFQNHLTCDSEGDKTCNKMVSLLREPDSASETDICYRFYRDICFEEDRSVFQAKDLRYDITVIMPGTIKNECKKTSGHYHGYINNSTYTYPEVYEVLEGRALYILQKVMNFSQEEEPVISDLKAVYVQKGQMIIIPPFYGHCSINAGDGPLVFSNLAVVSCPLYYKPIEAKHGLSLYACREGNGEITLIPNPCYNHVPEPSIVHPGQNEKLGIQFGHSVYHAFTSFPDTFDYLNHPEDHIDQIESLLASSK